MFHFHSFSFFIPHSFVLLLYSFLTFCLILYLNTRIICFSYSFLRLYSSYNVLYFPYTYCAPYFLQRLLTVFSQDNFCHNFFNFSYTQSLLRFSRPVALLHPSSQTFLSQFIPISPDGLLAPLKALRRCVCTTRQAGFSVANQAACDAFTRRQGTPGPSLRRDVIVF